MVEAQKDTGEPGEWGKMPEGLGGWSMGSESKRRRQPHIREGSDVMGIQHLFWDMPRGGSTDLCLGSWEPAMAPSAPGLGEWLSAGKVDSLSVGLSLLAISDNYLLVTIWPQRLKLHMIQPQTSLRPRDPESSSES